MKYIYSFLQTDYIKSYYPLVDTIMSNKQVDRVQRFEYLNELNELCWLTRL